MMNYLIILDLVDQIHDPYEKALRIKRMIATCDLFSNSLVSFTASEMKKELIKRQFDLSKLI